MRSRARGAFDLLPVEAPKVRLAPAHPQAQCPTPLPAQAGPSRLSQHCSVWYLLLLAPCPISSETPKNISPAPVQTPNISSTSGQRDISIGTDWEKPSTGSTLVPPQGCSLGTDPGSGVGITTVHWWDRGACEMPLVFKASAGCSPCLVLNLPSLAGIPAWAPSKVWEIRGVPLPTAVQEWCREEAAGESRRGLRGQVGSLGGGWALWGQVSSLGGRQVVSTVGETAELCAPAGGRDCCCLRHRAAAHHLPRGNSGCAFHIQSPR